MKNITLSIFAMIITFLTVACNLSSGKNEQPVNNTVTVSEEQPSSNAKDNNTAATLTANQAPNDKEKKEGQDFSIAPIITNYLLLKNALVSDDDKAAASAGKRLVAAWNKMDMKAIPAGKHKQYTEIADNAKEHAEHISENAGNIQHQREHLALLGEDLKNLIDLFGTSQTLHQAHCPMFNDNKGAVWFSESKEIKNPYYGSKMMTCGKVEKTINSK